MWKQKLCLGLMGGPGNAVDDQIAELKEIGYDAFFTGWREGAKVTEWAQAAKECDMIYQSIHVGWSHAAHMWHGDDEQAAAGIAEMTACLTDCARAEVPIMVAHAFVGFKDHSPTEIGLERFGKVIREAERLGVKIAFENTEGIEYLDALLKAYWNDKTVGFCWDSGHEMCYNYSRDLLALYGEKLIATHLNDNLGIKDFNGEITWHDDLHLLPFDGIADWRWNAQRLDDCGYRGILTFELTTTSKPHRHENDKYMRMPRPEYLAESYNRACRIAALRKLNMAD
ncbi:MAG: TIM barrel protein [Clostridia bacterium]|nr:TIM barrel protein [Clostridia bacterium]